MARIAFSFANINIHQRWCGHLTTQFISTRMHSSRMCTGCGSSCLRGVLPQCMLGHTPQFVGLETPQQVWAWRPPWPDPSTSPWVSAWRPFPHGQIPQLPPWVLARRTPWRPAARHAGIPRAMHAGIPPPPVNRMTDRCKNITFANSVCI